MFKRVLVLVFVLSFIQGSAFSITGTSARKIVLRNKLKDIKLPVGWYKCITSDPVVYQPCTPGDKMTTRDDSYLSVLVAPGTEPRLIDLKKKLRTRKLKAGSVVSGLKIRSVKRSKKCYTMNLQSPVTGSVRQTWCFGKEDAVVVTEKGPDRIATSTRSMIIKTAGAVIK